MEYGKQQDGDTKHDDYPPETDGGDLGPAVAKSTTKQDEAQAQSLIGLVLTGEDPRSLMNNVIDQIHETVLNERGGGPFHIGSKVKVNTAGSYPGVDGGMVSLTQHEAVAIINPFLGEHGKDAMVLLSDGKTRAILPFKVLGEQVGYLAEDDPLTGPELGVPAATGSVFTKPSRAQGEPEPDDVDAAQSPGASDAVSIEGPYQGQPEPDADPDAAKFGQSAPLTRAGVATEQRRMLLKAIDAVSESTPDSRLRYVMSIRSRIESTRNPRLLSRMVEMVFSKKSQFSLSQLEQELDKDKKDDDDKDADSPFPVKKTEQSDKDDKDAKSAWPPKKDDDDKDKPAAGQFSAKSEQTDDKDDKDDDDDKDESLRARLNRIREQSKFNFTETDDDKDDDDKVDFKPDEETPGEKECKEADDDKDKTPDPGDKDHDSPQGSPGKNPSAPGVTESVRREAKAAVKSLFTRIDESVKQ